MRAGFSLIEVLAATALFGVCAAALMATWSFCYVTNQQTYALQTAACVLERELERVRQLHWERLPEQTTWSARRYYDRNGQPVGAPGFTIAGDKAFVSFLKVETLGHDALTLAQPGAINSRSGNLQSLRRVTVRVQSAGVAAEASPPLAEAVTYLARGGP